MTASAVRETRNATGLPVGVWMAALIVLVVHLVPQPGYGFHRDEFLYLAMGDHLDLFRMQFPPMLAILAQTARALPLELLTAVRLMSALAGAAVALLAALLCHDLGGGKRSQVIAAASVLVAPLFLRAATLFQPVVFEQLWWTLAALALTRLLAGRDRRWWLALGAAVGLGALTKFSVAFLGVGLLAAVTLSPLRHDFRTSWPWLGVAVALLIAAPSVTGQMTWGWPFFEQARVLQSRQLVHAARLGFFVDQFMMLGAGAGLWLIGMVALLASPALRPFRPLGVLAAIVFLLLLIGNGKAYYFGPIHPLLLAAGAGWLGSMIPARGRRVAFAGALGWLAIGGLLLLPVGVPLLPPAPMARYAAALGITQATETNYGTVLPLPQDFADMTGWPELVDTVAAVFHSLPASEQGEAVILGINYGRTGAIALFGMQRGLPYPISRYGDFYQWGVGDRTGKIAIVVGGSEQDLVDTWEEVVLVAHARNRWGVEEEQEVPIFVCRRPRQDLRTMFLRLGPVWG